MADLSVGNPFPEAVDVYWISPSGERLYWERIPANSSSRIFKFNEWHFMFTDSAGRCLYVD